MTTQQTPEQRSGSTSGFIARNDPRLVLVPDWQEFVSWTKECGYGEAYLDINDSRCQQLQELYLEELRAQEGSGAAGDQQN